MSIVSRQAFIESNPQLDLTTISPRSWDGLAANGVERSKLEAIAGGDRVISGEEESGALYDLMFAQRTGNVVADLGRAEAVYDIVQSELDPFPVDFDFSFSSSARARTTGIFAEQCSAMMCHSSSGPGEAVEMFQATLKARAVERLESHQLALADEAASYSDLSDANPAWDRLERAAAKLAEIDAWVDMQREPSCSSNSCHTGELHAPLTAEEQAKVLRAELIEAVPALAVLDASDLANLDDRGAIAAKVQGGMSDYQAQIEDVIGRLDRDIPLHKLGNLVGEVMNEYGISTEARERGEPMAVEVMDWLDDQERAEAILQWTALGGSVALGIGAFMLPEFSVPLGLAGAGIGFGDAAYSFEMADDVYDAANASPFERQALADPGSAKADYAIGLASLVMAGADLAQAGWALRTMGAAHVGAVTPEAGAAKTTTKTAKAAGEATALDRLAAELPQSDPKLLQAVLGKGVPPDTIRAIVRDADALHVEGMSDRILAHLATKDPAEAAAAERMLKIELADGGHSIARHGPQLTDSDLTARLTLGLTPDGRQAMPPPASSRFTSFQRMLRTREDAERALKQRSKDNGWDITKGPGQGGNPPKNQMDTRVTYDFGKPIGRGHIPDGQPRTRVATVLDDSVMVEPNDITEFARERALAEKKLQPGTAAFDARVQQLANDPGFQAEHRELMNGGVEVWDGTERATHDITRSYTNFVFNGDKQRWVAVQHFPAASPPLFDPISGLYVNPADARRVR